MKWIKQMLCKWHDWKYVKVDLYERGIGFFVVQKDVQVAECRKCGKIVR